MAIQRYLMRVIDANLNRSREGLRVCEDICRFVLNSAPLTKDLKSVRHSISAIAKPVMGRNIDSRDSSSDVGKKPAFALEMRRSTIGDVFAANIERVKESIRVLEEFFKIIDIKSSARLTALRFRVYGIESAAFKKISAFRCHGPRRKRA